MRAVPFPLATLLPVALIQGCAVLHSPPPAPRALMDCRLTPAEQGLRLDPNASESHTRMVEVEGRTAWQGDEAAPGSAVNMLYFTVTAPELSDGAAPEVQLTIEYLDRGRGRVLLEYDSSDPTVEKTPEPGAFKTLEAFSLKGTGLWQAATLILEDARFSKHCNGSDFRLVATGDRPVLVVSRVEIVQVDAAAARRRSYPEKETALVLDMPGTDRTALEFLCTTLADQGFVVRTVTGAELCEPGTLTPAACDALVLPDAEHVPLLALGRIQDFVDRGGRLAAVGGPAFETPLVQDSDGRWVEVDALRTEIGAGDGHPLHLFQPPLDLEALERNAHSPDADTRLSVRDDGPDGQACLHMDIRDLQGFDTTQFPVPAAGRPEPDHDALRFLARADEAVDVVVEVRDRQGCRWLKAVRVGTEWQTFVMLSSEFPRWSAPDGLANPPEALSLADAEVIGFGVARSHGGRDGDHNLRFAGVMTADSEAFRRLLALRTDLVLTNLSPYYNTYPAPAITRLTGAADLQLTTPVTAVLPIARYHGEGHVPGRRQRCVPVLEARTADGRNRGLAMAVTVDGQRGPGAQWLTLGLPLADVLTTPGLPELLAETLAGMVRNPVLYCGGADRYTAFPGEPVQVGARVLNPTRNRRTVSVRFTVASAEGAPWTRETTLDLEPDADVRVEEHLPTPATGVHRVRTELVEGRRVIDTLEHELWIDDPQQRPEDIVRVRGDEFVLDGEPWYPIGVNYWPSYVSGSQPNVFFHETWLDPRNYDPARIERDLQALADLNLNAVSIQYAKVAFASNLKDFLRRCRAHGIKAHVFVGSADPVAFQPETVQRQIEAARLDRQPAVFSYDIAWEPNFRGDKRLAFDADWGAWILEQYGSHARAEQDWGMPVPRKDDGNPTAPSVEQLTTDGTWRTMVAAYRRFLDDLVSRRYNHACRFIRELDPHHLIGVRTGYGGTGVAPAYLMPYDLCSAARHLDYLSPEGYGMIRAEHHAGGGLNHAYSDLVSGGKPIIWPEFGDPFVHQDLEAFRETRVIPEDKLEAFGEAYDSFLRMIHDQNGKGALVWWFPGGIRLDEKSDFGIMNPDGTPRPTALALSHATRFFPEPVPVRKPVEWIEIDRDRHTTGYFGAFAEARPAYLSALAAGREPRLRTRGTGTDSATVPLVAVGNVPCTGDNPPKYLNSEFNTVHGRSADGRRTPLENGASLGAGTGMVLEVSLGNTQEAAWLAPEPGRAETGTVRLVGRVAGTPEPLVSVPIPHDVPFLEDVRLEVPVPDSLEPGQTLLLRLEARDRTPFGQVFRLTR